MRLFRIINKSFKDAFKSVFRNFSLSMASISCTAITLVLVAISVLFSYNVNSITKDIEDVLTIVVFIDKDATEEEISNIGDMILTNSNVDIENSRYNSPEEIKNQMIEEEETFKKFFDTLDKNPLKSTYIVKVKDVKKIEKTAKYIENIDKVSEVKYGENLVTKLLGMFDVIRTACIVAVVALIIVTAFLISNTIKITIFSRRQEIGIMRLVGTSNIVIKMPFIIEGAVLGVIGSLLPVLLTIFGYSYFYDYEGGKLFSDLIRLVDPEIIIYQTSLLLLIIGAVVGMFGSLRAVKRYLKV